MSQRTERARKSGLPLAGENSSPHFSQVSQQFSDDAELVALCQRFRHFHREWMERVHSLGVSSYDDDQDAGRELLELRMSWGRDLSGIQARPPRTMRGALAKLEVASTLFAWAGEGDGSASAFLALADCELRPFLCGSEPEPEPLDRADPSGQPGPLQWLAQKVSLRRSLRRSQT
jgi:hypothetical protein